MLARLMEAGGSDLPSGETDLPFTDAVADWAYEGVAAMYRCGIMNGTSDTLFSGKDNYTIEQAIVTMLRVLNESDMD